MTDQPTVRPDPIYDGKVPNPNRQRHILLSLSLPKAGEAHETVSLVKAVFDLVDMLHLRGGFQPEVSA